MLWYIQKESNRILSLEDEADALCRYAGFEDFETVDFALQLVDAIEEMLNQPGNDEHGWELYSSALEAFCDNPAEYVKTQVYDVYEYHVEETEYDNERGFYLDVAEEMEEIMISRGMVKRALIPQERKE